MSILELSTLKYKSLRNDGPSFETKILLHDVRQEMGYAIIDASIYRVFIYPLEDLSVSTVRRPTNNLEVTHLLSTFG